MSEQRVPTLPTAERRRRIQKILRVRPHTDARALAREMGVDLRTVRSDLAAVGLASGHGGGGGGHGGGSGRWLVSYADFVTLMFGFFLILWASAAQDPVKFSELALAFQRAFNTGAMLGQQGTGSGAPPDPRDQSWAYMETHPYSIRHEILTGSQPDGRAFPPQHDHTCNNWTSEDEGNSPLRARTNTGPGAEIGQPEAGSVWNSHGISGGCSHESLARSHGAGLFYCFASN